MKNNLVRVSILVLGAAAAYAQSPSSMKANIPFDFTVRGMNFPAGNYSVDTTRPPLVTLQSDQYRNAVMVPTNAAQSVSESKDPQLVFHRYGNRYFLSDIWIGGSNFGRHVPASKAERNLAQHQTTPAAVVVSALP